MKASRGRIAAVLLAALAAAGCGAEQEEIREPARPVVLAPTEVRDLDERIEVTGELVARHRAVLAAEVSGRVSQIVFDEGQPVDEGQVILEIDPERRELEVASARAGVAEARADLRERERDYGRVRTLNEQQIASAQRLDQARTARDLARARVDAAVAQADLAERALSDSSVTAPFSGRIARRFVGQGEFVNPGTPLVDLVALDPIDLEFHVAERDTSRIAVGQEVLVTLDAHPDERFGATVTMISPAIDTRTRTLRVLARLENDEGRLLPGLFARADLGVATRANAILVPEEAVLQRADGAVVFRLGPGNRVLRTPVEIGTHRAGAVEVLEGLGPRDRVVTRGHASLTDGELVSPRDRDGTPIQAELAVATPPGEPTP